MTHLELEISGTLHKVSIEPDGDMFHVRIDGKEHLVDSRTFDGYFFSLLVDGRSHEVTVEHQVTPGGASEGFRIQTGLHTVEVLRLDPLRPVRASKAGVAAGPLAIRAVMPGKVTRLLVKPGETVSAGQPLLVLEAMKMENEVQAPRAGVVGRIHIEAGTAVEGGADLIVLEAAV